ncbi:methyltransferase domain-containing protein [Alphaproteobacteria bacterium]|nr:methyltransferase domain-containing protein [Alphaproteobacteria bacterium]
MSTTGPYFSGSFRDPNGRLALVGNRYVRHVVDQGLDDLEASLSSNAVDKMMETGRLILTRRLTNAEADSLRQSLGAKGGVLLEHRAVPFPSFPYEWPVEMLYAAATLALDLADAFVLDGLGLKDATPLNIFFDGPRPVWVDFTSIEKRAPNDALWRPAQQFHHSFLLPLLAARSMGMDLRRVFLTNPEGLHGTEMYNMTNLWTRLVPPHLGLVSLPVWASKFVKSNRLYTMGAKGSTDKARYIFTRYLRSRRRVLERLQPRSSRRSSSWGAYTDNLPYHEVGIAAKETYLRNLLERLNPEWVLDLGCNTGTFSVIAAELGAKVVSVDNDPAVVGALWQTAVKSRLDILPLVQNIGQPSPATGWRNAERQSFLDRTEKRFDVVLVLALLHHLVLTDRVPLDDLADMLGRIVRDTLVIEFVDPDDPMFRRLLRGRGAYVADFNQNQFETVFLARFNLKDRTAIPESKRILYNFQVKNRIA